MSAAPIHVTRRAARRMAFGALSNSKNADFELAAPSDDHAKPLGIAAIVQMFVRVSIKVLFGTGNDYSAFNRRFLRFFG